MSSSNSDRLAYTSQTLNYRPGNPSLRASHTHWGSSRLQWVTDVFLEAREGSQDLSSHQTKLSGMVQPHKEIVKIRNAYGSFLT